MPHGGERGCAACLLAVCGAQQGALQVAADFPRETHAAVGEPLQHRPPHAGLSAQAASDRLRLRLRVGICATMRASRQPDVQQADDWFVIV